MTVLNRKATRNIALWTAFLIATLVGRDTNAQIGFKATLDYPPGLVSRYDYTPVRISFALQAHTVPSLFKRQPYELKLVGASHETNSLIFNTYYLQKDSLIAVSVDADEYLKHNLQKSWEQRSTKNFRDAFVKAGKGDGRRGVNFGVALPKRFDKVFGEGGGNLQVSGYRRITFSGRSQWTDGQSEAIKQSKFPSLNMEQNYRFDITGTIGSKISVKVSEDSRSVIPLSNRIQIRYKGDDDDILKTLEAGNTDLSLPRSKFVGYSSRIQGLFGVKAEAQVGHLTVTAIASQEKGSAEKKRFSASGEESAEYIRDYEYQQGRIFDLGPDTAFSPGDSIKTLYVYEVERDNTVLTANDCILLVDPRDPEYKTEARDKGLRMVPLEQSLYTFYDEAEKNRHYVIFNSPRYSSNALGVYMEVKRASSTPGNDVIDTIGNLQGDTLMLMSLSPTPGNNTPSHPTWGYMWRNVYKIPKGAAVEDLHIVIKKGKGKTEDDPNNLDYQAVGQTQGQYVEILGLDQYNTQGELVPDRIVDERLDVFRPDLGLLIFPSRTPFDTDTTFGTGIHAMPGLDEKVPSIYKYESPTERIENSKYYIQISTTSRSTNISLRTANIIEGSERITLNGRTLVKDQDYTIQYEFGSVTLLSDDALDPNAELDIEFEYAPFLAIQKKSLLGLRAEYEWSKDLKFGGTFLYKSDKAQDRKPKVGQETAQMMVLDFDAAFTIRPNFLTKAVDALPLVQTEAPSNLSVVAEVAQSRPNPNVDNTAYIDDFEASHDQLSLGLSRSNWHIAAPPGHLGTGFQKGKILWHNTLYGVPANEVYDRDFKKGEGVISPFRMIFRPNPLLRDSAGTVLDSLIRRPSWGGITRYFRSQVDEKRVQLLELRVRGNHGRIHMDFGKISEDVNGDGAANTEDGSYNGAMNSYVEIEEDIGLDLLPDSLEPGFVDRATTPDPNGDNWFFLGDGTCPLPPNECAQVASLQEAARDGDSRYDSLYYEWLNGTEGNRDDLTSQGRPDEELLSNDGFSESDAYFSFVIDLDSTNFLVPLSENDYGWKTYRIPIRDSLNLDTIYSSSADLQAKWSKISHVRIWFEDDGRSDQADTLEVASWYFVQSNWRDSLIVHPVGVSNSSFVVATVSEEDGTFSAPPGVVGYEDKANDITETQRGLALIYKDLRAKDTCLAEKELLSVENYSGYGNLEVYVHGDEHNLNDSVLFFFRIGDNDSTFYEYQSPTKLYPGWDERNYVSMDFNEITVLKDSAQRTLPDNVPFRNVDITHGQYRVRGDPNINEITYFAAGIVNLDTTRGAAGEVTGEVWLDELRVTNVRRDIGIAARVTVSGNLADLISYNFGYDSQDAYFRGISSATRGGGNNNLGSGSTQESLTYSTTFNLHKLVPRAIGLTLPVSFSYSKSTQTPILRPRSDVILPERIREEEQTVSETKSFRVSESFRHKGKNLLYDVLLNRQKFAFSYSRSNQQSPVRPYSIGENYNVSGDFEMGWPKPPTLPILFFLKPIPVLKRAAGTQLGLFPSSWNFSGKFNRSLSVSDDLNYNRTSSLRTDLNGSMRMKYDMFQNLGFTFSMNTKRDLSDPDLVTLSFKPSKMRLGLETNYSQNFGTNYDPKILAFLGTKYGYSSSYSESYERSTKSRKSDMSQTWNVSGSFQHQALLGGRSRGSSSGRGGRGGTTQRRDVRGGGAKTEEAKKPFYEPVLAGMRFLTGWLDPLSYKYSQSFSKSVPGMLTRPSWNYRLGFTKEPEVVIVSDRRPASASQTVGYEFGSGFGLLGGIATTVSFKRSISTDLIRQGSRFERTSTSWPSLSIRIQRFTTLPLIKKYVNKFIDIFSPKTSYGRDVKEDFDLTGGFVTSRTENINYSPLLSITFKLFRSLSFSGSYTLTNSKREGYRPTSGELINRTRTDRRSIAFTSQYSFSSPGGISIPLFGKLKFKFDVNINLNVRKNTSKSETASLGDPFTSSEDKEDMTISPVISYTFSRQVKGGITARWQDTADYLTNRKSHVRELQIWAEIRF